ncbi:response regulator transcription factor [Heyndrickxia acidicola]|uniref:Response regulator transcription factor n=1 Tax=Heyndrickxia acidicola TaxID=209389 RepID=A0ABU6MH58_9BACI|nr:response regulator transcription factor [Heyndrickxia acidicola]MED1203346.1 response regulator transcription factor [Heyndrickxia acidicola]
MSLSLNSHMKMVLKKGVDLLFEHKEQIILECSDILSYLKETNKKSAEAFEFACRFFAGFLESDQSEADILIEKIKSEYIQQFQRAPEPNLIIFILTLIENAVHKVIKSNTTRSYHLHPSVQYLFSKICEGMLTISKQEHFNVDSFCSQIVHSKQLKIEWIARIEHVEEGYQLRSVIGLPEEIMDEERIRSAKPSWFLITEALLDLTRTGEEEEETRDVFPVPWKKETLLFCSFDKDVHSTAPFLTYALHLLQMEDAKAAQDSGDQWKDAVILFSEWIMRSQNLHDAIEHIAYGYAQYLPFERCALFQYSYTDEMGHGLTGYHFNDHDIRSIRENVDNIPFIYKSLSKIHPQNARIKNFQPIYISNAAEEFPDQYVRQFQLESVIVTPIYVPSEGKLIGAAILDQGPGKHFEVDSSTITALLKFGQSAGELLTKFTPRMDLPLMHLEDREMIQLTAREIDVLELLAEGASTTEAAEQLHLSEYTVRDYISTIMKRLKARNRTEAAVKAIRMGLIK